MEFPYGHNPHRHHHHHSSSSGDDDGSARYPPMGTNLPRPGYDHPTPPPYPAEGFYQPPPSYPPPPTAYPPPPALSQHYSSYPPHQPPVLEQHVSHEAAPTRPSCYPHMPSFPHHHTQNPSGTAASSVVPEELASKPTFKVYCKANPSFALTIRDEKVVLVHANPSDPYQHWYKDEKYSTRVKDEEGSPCFALVNQATGLAIKHSVGASHPVQLIPYTSDRLDESILWAVSKDFGDGYRTIRMINNIRLNMDALHGDKKSGGVHDGMTIVLWQWNKGDNQLWKITPYVE